MLLQQFVSFSFSKIFLFLFLISFVLSLSSKLSYTRVQFLIPLIPYFLIFLLCPSSSLVFSFSLILIIYLLLLSCPHSLFPPYFLHIQIFNIILIFTALPLPSYYFSSFFLLHIILILFPIIFLHLKNSPHPLPFHFLLIQFPRP